MSVYMNKVTIFPMRSGGVFMKIMTLGHWRRLDFWRFDPFGHRIKELVLSSGLAFSQKGERNHLRSYLVKIRFLFLFLLENYFSLDKVHI